MVDVSTKAPTLRIARARGSVRLARATIDLIEQDKIAKGNVFATARIAGILAAKRADELIPLCHSLLISAVEIEFEPLPDEGRIEIRAQVSVTGSTGAEIEALMAVSMAGLTIYDMIKGVDRAASLSDIELLFKSGGASGEFSREKR